MQTQGACPDRQEPAKQIKNADRQRKACATACMVQGNQARAADRGWRADRPPGGRRGDPVTKRKKRRWSAASSSVSASSSQRTTVLPAVYLPIWS